MEGISVPKPSQAGAVCTKLRCSEPTRASYHCPSEKPAILCVSTPRAVCNFSQFRRRKRGSPTVSSLLSSIGELPETKTQRIAGAVRGGLLRSVLVMSGFPLGALVVVCARPDDACKVAHNRGAHGKR
jgi:hypothetical protein